MQEIAVFILLFGALAYLGWRLYLRLQKKVDCGPDCGCSPKSATFSQSGK